MAPNVCKFKVGDRVAWSSYDSSRAGFGETYSKRIPGVVKRAESFGQNYDVLFDDGKTHYVNECRLVAEPSKPLAVGARVRWNPEASLNADLKANRSSDTRYQNSYNANKPGTIESIGTHNWGNGVLTTVRFDGDGGTVTLYDSRLMRDTTPVALTPKPAPQRALVAGDRVQFNREATINKGASAFGAMDNALNRTNKNAFDKDLHGKLTSTACGASVTWDDGTTSTGMFLERLKHEEAPKTMGQLFTASTQTNNSSDKARAMTFEQAKEQRTALILGLGLDPKSVIVRTRSWSHDGTFGAVEIPAQAAKLYTVDACKEYLRVNGTVYDAFMEKYRSGYRFLTEAGLCVNAPDGLNWWTEEEIRQCKGVTSFQGKRYRLCVKVVRPMYEAGILALTTK